MAETQRRAMEIERFELEAILKRRCVILDIVTLMEKGIKILDLKQFMWTQMKQNYDNMLNRWRIGRILLRKKIGLLKQSLFHCF
jgi:hypothetical protein